MLGNSDFIAYFVAVKKDEKWQKKKSIYTRN